MKRFLILVCGIFAVSYGAQASYLVWQVNSEYGGMNTVCAWDTANLYAVKGTEMTLIETQKTGDDPAVAGFTGESAVDISKFEDPEHTTSAYSFYIELINSTGTTRDQQFAGDSKRVTYASLSASIASNLDEVPYVTTWHGGTFTAPEPTSGVLMLLGVAGLALRRKQRKSE